MKRLVALLLALSLLAGYGAATAQSLPEPEIPAREMFLGETASDSSYEATLYYISSDGASLTRATRTLLVHGGDRLLDVVLEALFSASNRPAQSSIAPGDTRLISCEVTGGVVTVNLSIEARNVQSEQELLMMYLAISATLLELEGIQGVNVLINGRHESVLQLPCGIMCEIEEDATAAWAQVQSESERYFSASKGSLTRNALIYLPSADGSRLVPEMREITFTSQDQIHVLLSELCAQPESLRCAVPVFSSEESPLVEDPVLTVTGSGERILEINLRSDAVNASRSAGVNLWQIYGCVTMSVCSFIPEIDAVHISIDGAAVSQAVRDGETIVFDGELMRRRDFSGLTGSAAQLYIANENGDLILRETVLSQGAALSPRALLSAIFSADTAAALGGACPVPSQVDATDILGVRIEDRIATVNLSSRFYSACQDLTETRERTVVYSIVNTLCGLDGIDGVRFLFEGESVETLTEHIYMRTTLLPNPGAVVTE